MDEKGRSKKIHIIDFGLARVLGHTHTPKPMKLDKPWYCHCFFRGARMQARCDVLSLGFLMNIFLRKVMTGEYRVLVWLVMRTF